MAILRKTAGKIFRTNGKIGLSLMIVAVTALAAIAVAAVVLPNIAPVAQTEAPTVSAITVENEGLIAVGADMSQVYVTVRYSDDTVQKVALSELVVTGLDTRVEGKLKNVVLKFGNFTQTVEYEVVPADLTLQYIANTGGRIEGDAVQSVPAGSDATRVEAVPDEGYEFVRWNDGVVDASRLDKQVSASQKIYAVFRKLTYVVVFYYPDLTTAREEIVAYNEAPTHVPSKTDSNMQLYGYRFVGWSVDYSHITADTLIYPIFEKYATDIRIDYTMDNEGLPLGTSNARAFYQMNEQAVISVTANSQRIFTGWQIQKANGEWEPLLPENNSKLINVAAGTSLLFETYRTGTSDSFTLAFTPTEKVPSINLRAKFVFETSTISFTSMTSDKPTGKIFDDISLAYGQKLGTKFSIAANPLTTIGYDFHGWYKKGDESQTLLTDDATFDQPTTLVAKWSKCIYTVVFLQGDNQNPSFSAAGTGFDPDAGGVGKGGRILTAYYQDNLSKLVSGVFPEQTPTKTNYTFKGWYLCDAERQPTNKVIDKTYKIEAEIVYVIPVFTVNTVSLVSSIKGSGSISNVVYHAATDEETETRLQSSFVMEVISDYKFRLRAGEGYSITSYTLNGVTVYVGSIDSTHYYDIEISSILVSQDYMRANVILNVVFTAAEHTVSIVNGSGSVHGEIYYAVSGGTEGGAPLNDANIAITVVHGASKNLEITAPAGYYISSVTKDGAAVALPTQPSYHTVVLSNITSNIQVIVSYAEFRYAVTVKDASTLVGGSVTFTTPAENYPAGASPSLEISASDGYYIQSVSVNGTAVDPYVGAPGYHAEDLVLNGVVWTAAMGRDVRLTFYKFVIESISQDLNVSVSFAPLYYIISASVDGSSGVVTAPSGVNYGGSFSATVITDDDYYVEKVIVNGVASSYSDKFTSRDFTVNNVTRDYTVVFVVKINTYTVSFRDGGGRSSVSMNGGTVYSEELKTFTGVVSRSDNTFLITADEGYKFSYISVQIGGGTPVYETLSDNATSHVIQINGILSDYNIEISCEILALDVSLYVSNVGSASAVSLDGELATHISGAVFDTVTYGGTFTVYAIPEEGVQRLNAAYITVVNRDSRDTAVYARLSADNSSLTTGYFYVQNTDAEAGKWALFIKNITTDIEVYFVLEDIDKGTDEPYAVEINAITSADGVSGAVTTVSTGSPRVAATPGGTLTASGANGNIGYTTSAITYTASPAAGYELASLTVDGRPVATVKTGANYTYVYDGISANQTATAVFVKKLYTVTTPAADNGTVSATASFISIGSTVTVHAYPATGYNVSKVTLLVGETITHLAVAPYLTDGVFSYDVQLTAANAGNITVTAEFAAIGYEARVTVSGNGTVNGESIAEKNLSVSYGDKLTVAFASAPDSFISAVYVGGKSVAVSSLASATVNSDINKVVSGDLFVTVTGDLEINVVYDLNIYSVTAASTLHGSVTVRKASSGGNFVAPSSLPLYAGDYLYIKMSADYGYHVSSVTINGVEVRDWKPEGADANDVSTVFYTYGLVGGNVTVRVVYAINEYTITVNASNVSKNFASVDTTASAYGTVTISGRTPEGNVYSGITHGSDVKLILTPRTGKGYYVSLFEISYYNQEESESLITVNMLPYINALGGSYTLQSVEHNIQSVRVEFKRRLFTFTVGSEFDNLDTSTAFLGGVSVRFSVSTGAPVIPDEGKYEYGISYSIDAKPGVGYSRTAFFVNGVDQNANVRSDTYSGSIVGDMNILGTYEIMTFRVAFTAEGAGDYMLSNGAGDIVWSSLSANTEETVSTSTGRIWVYANYIVATYGTRIGFVAIPHNLDNNYNDSGYKLESLTVNGAAKQILSPNGVTREYLNAISELNGRAVFTVNTYSVYVPLFEGGSASLSASTVQWNGTIALTVRVDRGYYLNDVLINGVSNNDIKNALSAQIETDVEESKGTYYITNIDENKNIVIRLQYKEYDVTFDVGGDYGAVFNIYAADGETVRKQVRAVTSIVTNKNLATAVSRAFSSDDGTIDPASGMIVKYEGGVYVGARYNDTLTFYFTAPLGYVMESVSIIMEGSSLYIRQPEELDEDDGSGTRTYTISGMTGNVSVNVTYRIRTFLINCQDSPSGAYIAKESGSVSYFEQLDLQLLANLGFHLSTFIINGKAVATSYSKSGNQYLYSTTVGGIMLEVNDELLNGLDMLTVTPTYARQNFEVVLYINSVMITETRTDPTLTVNVPVAKIEYNSSLPTVFTHNLTAGYSITQVTLSNKPAANSGDSDYFAQALEVGAKANSLDVWMGVGTGENIFNSFDIYKNNLNRLYVYYTTRQDEYDVGMSYYYVRESGGVNTASSFGLTDGGSIPENAFRVNCVYSDQKTQKHIYGTEANFTAVIDPLYSNSYTFAGFQEYRNGTWGYVVPGTNGIILQNNGMTMTFAVTGEREFRGVFFKLYAVVVTICPEYKYISGAFTAGEVSNMLYAKYAILTATATYEARGDIVTPNMTTATLTDKDGDPTNAVFVYYVASGGKLKLVGGDTNPVNPTGSGAYAYDEITYPGGAFTTTPAAYGSGNEEILRNKTVYAYYKNKAYLSVLYETIGATAATAGGTANYTVKGATKNLSSTNSLEFEAGDTITITINPNSNYIFDSVSRLIAATSSTTGYKQYTSSYSDYATTADGKVTLVYYNSSNAVVDPLTYSGRITKVVLTLKAQGENEIIRIRYRKIVQLTSSVQLVSTETDAAGNPVVLQEGATPSFNVAANGAFEYGDTVSVELNTYIFDSRYNVYYQFVGFMINGVNNFKYLASSYPYTNVYTGGITENITLDIVLNDSIGIREVTRVVEGVSVTTYNLDIVAKYVPIYNIVLVNEYVYEGTYLNPETITATTIEYDGVYPQFYTTTETVAPSTSSAASERTDKFIRVPGKVNTVAAYDTWRDNTITLNWAGYSLAGSNYNFVAWQYYNAVEGIWKNIPYTDPNSSTNVVTKRTFTFPVSCLLAYSYITAINQSGGGISTTNYQYTLYDTESHSEYSINALRIRPLFQRYEKLSIKKWVAVNSEDDGYSESVTADINPYITSNNNTTGNFAYGSTLTVNPASRTGYEFKDWAAYCFNYLTDEYEFISLDNNNYLEYGVSNKAIFEAATNMTYTFDPNSNELTIGSLTETLVVYAHYIRVYTITIKTTNISGSSNDLLIGSTPTINYYDAVVQPGDEPATPVASGERTYILRVRVGKIVQFGLDTGYEDDGIANGTTTSTGGTYHDYYRNSRTYDPFYDNFYGVSITDASGSGVNLWDLMDSSEDYMFSNSYARNLQASSGVSAIESARFNITANADKTINIKFRSTGVLVIYNVYKGSAVKLPNALKNALGLENAFVTDSDNDGKIVITGIPITENADYDGKVAGDFGNRLTSSLGILASDKKATSISFNGENITSKVQYFIYYGECDASTIITGYEVVGGIATEIFAPATVIDDSFMQTGYPFAADEYGDTGNGSSEFPFLISTLSQLRNIGALYNGNGYTLSGVHFRIVADINLVGFDEPMCVNGGGFNGYLSARKGTSSESYILYDMVYTLTTNYTGIFAKTGSGTIEYITLGGVNASAKLYAGFLAGYAAGTTIRNITTNFATNYGNDHKVRGTQYVGIIVGYATSGTQILNCNISNFTVNANVYGGAIAGLLYGSESVIQNCTTNGANVEVASYGGGIVGALGMVGDVTSTARVEGSLADSPNLSSPNNLLYIGGVVGYVSQASVVLTTGARGIFTVNSATSAGAFADVAGYASYGGGGIAGYNAGNITECYLESGQITLKGAMVGGIVGVNIGTVALSNTGTASLSLNRQYSSVWEGGAYGGHVGYNRGSIMGAVTSRTGYAQNYTRTDAFFEVRSNSDTYTTVSGGNVVNYYANLQNDSSYVFLGGIVGYNDGNVVAYEGETTTQTSFRGKLMFNRRSGDGTDNYTYIGGIAGMNRKTINTSGTIQPFIAYYRYLYTDSEGEGVSREYLGGVYGFNSSSATGTATLSYLITYVGAGVSYTPAVQKPIVLSWTCASGYNAGHANLVVAGVSNPTYTAYCGFNIDDAMDDKEYSGTVIAPLTINYADEVGIGLIYNGSSYSGNIRQVAVTVG